MNKQWPTRLVWRFWFAPPAWSEKMFGIQYAAAQLGGVLYAGITILGRSIIYSSEW